MINIEAKFNNISTTLDEFSTILRNVQSSIHMIKNQVRKLAKENSGHTPCSLSSNIESNPREHLKAITLRSGK